MFICTIVVVVAILRKAVYMQECMNYTFAMQPLSLGLYNLQVHLHSA